MRAALLIGIAILSVFIVTEVNRRKMKNYYDKVEEVIRNAYKKSWGSGAGMKILGIHRITGQERITKPIYFVAIIANGKKIYALSEIILEKKSTFHRKLTEKEKKDFLDSHSGYNKKYEEFMKNYK